MDSASTFQLSKLTNQATTLITFYKLSLSCPGSDKTVTRWVANFEKNEGKFSERKKGKYQRRWILNADDLKNKAIYFIKCFPKKKTNEQQRDIKVLMRFPAFSK